MKTTTTSYSYVSTMTSKKATLVAVLLLCLLVVKPATHVVASVTPAAPHESGVTSGGGKTRNGLGRRTTTVETTGTGGNNNDDRNNNKKKRRKPNIIVIQPDDLPFYDPWTPPPKNPNNADGASYPFPGVDGLPNLEYLRTNGVQMMQSYASSPACGTSRYSTITGRYASRSAYESGRGGFQNNGGGNGLRMVTIPNTKLVGQDCATHNLAATLRAAGGYRTGFVGKWHLSDIDGVESYEQSRERIRQCGFDVAEAIYMENMGGTDGYSHNMEYLTYEAIQFMNGSSTIVPGEEEEEEGKEKEGGKEQGTKPFFLYFNPTVPHPGRSVREALMDYSCRDTPEGRLAEEPAIRGMTTTTTSMTEDSENNDITATTTTTTTTSCGDYRQNLIQRADSGGAVMASDTDLGALWIDDSIGAILDFLRRAGEFDDTIILFQMDHGKEAKMTLYENGVRTVQFFHYPAGGLFEEKRGGGVEVLSVSGINATNTTNTSTTTTTTAEENEKAATNEVVDLLRLQEYNGQDRRNREFHGLVSTIDVAPTLLDYAGIDDGASSSHYYPMDGVSWKSALSDVALTHRWSTQRCLLLEHQYDRAVRCGTCHKLLRIDESASSGGGGGGGWRQRRVQRRGGKGRSQTLRKGRRFGYDAIVGDTYFDLCDDTAAAGDGNDGDGTGVGQRRYVTYVSSRGNNPEASSAKNIDDQTEEELGDVLACFLDKTSSTTEGQNEDEKYSDVSPCSWMATSYTEEEGDHLFFPSGPDNPSSPP